MKKSTCIITLPRTGSYLLMNHISVSKDLEHIGEFLCQSRPHTFSAVPTTLNKNFRESYKLEPADIKDFLFYDYFSFVRKDFHDRINIIDSYQKGIVVKAFVLSEYYKLFPTFIDILFDKFNVIILTRKNSFNSILSGFICRELNTWHVIEDEKLPIVKDKLSTLRFSISENHFIKAVQEFNMLNSLYNNAHLLYPDVISLCYEDFQNNPTLELNDLLGTNLLETDVIKLNKFIDDHESHIINIERIKQLYRLYNV